MSKKDIEDLEKEQLRIKHILGSVSRKVSEIDKRLKQIEETLKPKLPTLSEEAKEIIRKKAREQ